MIHTILASPSLSPLLPSLPPYSSKGMYSYGHDVPFCSTVLLSSHFMSFSHFCISSLSISPTFFFQILDYIFVYECHVTNLIKYCISKPGSVDFMLFFKHLIKYESS